MTSTFNWMLQCGFCCCAATDDVSPCNVFQFKQAEHINKREWHWAVFKGCFVDCVYAELLLLLLLWSLCVCFPCRMIQHQEEMCTQTFWEILVRCVVFSAGSSRAMLFTLIACSSTTIHFVAVRPHIQTCTNTFAFIVIFGHFSCGLSLFPENKKVKLSKRNSLSIFILLWIKSSCPRHY